MKEVEISDKRTVDEAIEAGLEQLGVSAEDAEVEVLSAGGLFARPKVRIRVKEGAAARALKFAEKLLKHMNIDAIVEMHDAEDEVKLEIIGMDTAVVLGYRGEVLDAITYLTSLSANHGISETDRKRYKRVVVDCENYRQKRTETLEGLAERMAAKAAASGRRVLLEPMNPYERRVIHMKLQDNQEVTAHSEGEEPNRYLVIVPKNEKPFSPREGNDRRGNRGGNRGNDRRGGGRNDRGGFGRNDRSARNDRSGRSSPYISRNAFSDRPAREFPDRDLSREGKNYTADSRYNKD